MRKTTDVFLCRRAFGGTVEEGTTGPFAQRSKRGVLYDRQVEHKSLALAVLGEKANAKGDACCSVMGKKLLPANGDAAGADRIESHDGFRQLGPARTHETEEAHNLTRPSREADIPETGWSSETLHPEDIAVGSGATAF
jgi:hypothetical protein